MCSFDPLEHGEIASGGKIELNPNQEIIGVYGAKAKNLKTQLSALGFIVLEKSYNDH